MIKIPHIWIVTALLWSGAMCLSAQAANDYELPSIGQPVDTAISPQEEKQIGRDIVRQLRGANYLLEDIELRYYLKDLGYRLASYSDYDPSGFDFFIVRDRQINAFALPGGFIGMNAGLILATRNEDELAGVLAHEIAHVTQRHIARQIQASGSFNVATIAALVVAILAGASDPDVAQAALSLGVATSQQQRINFTRTHEMEADRVGIRTLAEAGYDPLGMATFFQQMEERARLYGSGLPEILRTHPVSNTRISEAQSRAAKYGGELRKDHDSLDYELMQARLRVLTAIQAGTARSYFAPELENTMKPGARFGHSLALVRSGRYEEATRSLQTLADSTRHPSIDIALAQAQLSAGLKDEARTTLADAMERYSAHVPLTLAYAELLIRINEAEQSRRVILAAELVNSSEPEAHRLLAVAAHDLSRNAEANYQMAEYHRLRGEYREALNQLNAGIRNDDTGDTDKARLQEALKNLKKEVPDKLMREIKRERNVHPLAGS